ncbi:hypothetical protein, partial [uncultured Prevotella sp.]|uniref:hypothetical protein n=1 Tax=uncultured Prevotella sp. TaxID=159272 RepID=UPI00266EC052
NNWLYIFSFNDNTDNGRQIFCAIQTMVDNFFVQWSNVAFIIVEHCQYCRFKNNWLYIFSFNDNTDNGRQFFVQWSNDAFIIVEHCQYCRFKKQWALYF